MSDADHDFAVKFYEKCKRCGETRDDVCGRVCGKCRKEKAVEESEESNG